MGFPDMDPPADAATEELTGAGAEEAAAPLTEQEAAAPVAEEAAAPGDEETPVTDEESLAPVNGEEAGAAEASDDRSVNGQSSPDAFSAEELMPDDPVAATATEVADASLKAVLEALVFVTGEPLTLDQIALAIEQPRERVADLLDQLAADYEQPSRGLSIKEVAG